jgi:membrane protein DedA with SNARE-associated domain
MNNDTAGRQPDVKPKWYERRVFAILTLVLVLAIIGGVFYFYQTYPEKIEALEEFGYLGAFLVSIILNATVVLPAGNFFVLAALGATLPSPILVGLAGGIGAAIGEMTGYAAGYSGRGIIQRRKLYTRLEGWVGKWGMLTIFIMSVVPFVFDLAGIAAGALRFPIWKFFLATWAGRTILYIGIAWAGSLGWDALIEFLGGG